MITMLMDVQVWLSLLILILLELILGIDNLIFLSIITSRLPANRQKTARRLGLSLALIMRLVLLAFAFAMMAMRQPLFVVFNYSFSIRDIFLLLGGLFLFWKAINELRIGLHEVKNSAVVSQSTFTMVVIQIMLLDMVFSLDSILTAVGIAKYYWIMAVAITIAIIFMLFASEPLSRFIQAYPRIRRLALCFLLLIAIILILDGLNITIGKTYAFVAFGFSLFVELVNIAYEKYEQ